MAIPYKTARSGTKAREEITKILRHFGCEQVGFMDEFETKSLLLVFTWNGKSVQLRASASGWANAYLKESPWTSRMRTSRKDYENKAIEQGIIAVNSILRDWVKGQVTAIETGILTFEHVFMPHMLTSSGVTMIEQYNKEQL